MLQVAWITLRRITEKAVLIQFGVLAAVLAYLGLGLDTILGSDVSDAEQNGIGVIWLFLAAFSVFWTTIEIPRELSRKEVHVYLSKPVTRLQYLLGKLAGTIGMVLGGELFLLGVLAACLKLAGAQPSAALLISAARAAFFLVLLNAMCLSASVLFAEVPAILLVLAVAGAGCTVFALPVLAWAGYDTGYTAAMMGGYRLLPNLLHYRWEPPDRIVEYLTWLSIYTIGWTGVCLLLAYAAFLRRDLP